MLSSIGGMQKWAWPALGLFVLACFWGFWSYGPFDLDEGLYAVALMEMQERGDWVEPTYRGAPFFEKPILFYWTAWIADLCGADGVVALRLPSILTTMGTLALVGLFTKRIGAVMILSVSVLFMGVGRMFMPDPFLIFGMTLALFSFWKTRDDPRWYLAAGAGLAIAVLAKGPMPIVVFGLLGLYCRLRMEPWPRLPNVRRWRLAGIGLFLAAALPWYIAAASRSDAFVQEFLIKQNLGRLSGGDVVHLGPIWMYIPVVLIGLMPFSLTLIGAWRKREGGLEQYLWAFVLIVFVLFSVAGTKLPHYILPIFPALAVLIDRYHDRSTERLGVIYALVAFAIGSGLMIYGLFFGGDAGPYAMTLGLVRKLLMIGGGISYLWFAYRRAPASVHGFAAMGPFVAIALAIGPRWYWVITHLDPTYAAMVADTSRLPIVEYRTGGERERGKTSHPSMQWTIGRNTEVAESYAELRKRIERGPIALITRDGRLETDQMRHSLALGNMKLLERFGAFEVYSISPIQTPVE